MQFHQLKRRELMTLAGLAAAWPLAVRAQQSVTPVIGYLNFGSPGPLTRTVTSAFQRGLSELGFIEGRNIAIESAGLMVILSDCQSWPPTLSAGMSM